MASRGASGKLVQVLLAISAATAFEYLPQALSITPPQTVGYPVQPIKITALTSIFGSEEPVRASCAISGEPFEHLTVFELLKLNYFALCIPFMLHARMQEIRAAHWAANGTLPAG